MTMATDCAILVLQTVQPTPRVDRISQDYAHEFPDVEVESRKVTNKQKRNMENVKLTEEVRWYFVELLLFS